MRKQLGIILLVLAIAVGLSGTAVAAYDGNMTQTPGDNQWMKSGYSMWMKYMMTWMNMWWMKMMYWMQMLMGGNIPRNIPGNMSMNMPM